MKNKKNIKRTTNYRRAINAYWKFYICSSVEWQTTNEAEDYLIKKYGKNRRTYNTIKILYMYSNRELD